MVLRVRIVQKGLLNMSLPPHPPHTPSTLPFSPLFSTIFSLIPYRQPISLVSSLLFLYFFCIDEQIHVYFLLFSFFIHEEQHTIDTLAFCFMQLLQTSSKRSSFFFFSVFSFMMLHYLDVHSLFVWAFRVFPVFCSHKQRGSE